GQLLGDESLDVRALARASFLLVEGDGFSRFIDGVAHEQMIEAVAGDSSDIVVETAALRIERVRQREVMRLAQRHKLRIALPVLVARVAGELLDRWVLRLVERELVHSRIGLFALARPVEELSILLRDRRLCGRGAPRRCERNCAEDRQQHGTRERGKAPPAHVLGGTGTASPVPLLVPLDGGVTEVAAAGGACAALSSGTPCV